eukprot:scaffold1635_cov124-Skeletonema_dohrnii-CCMP3373.AAC.1
MSSCLVPSQLAVVVSNYFATRKILRDEKPELPTPSALETASNCHECPFALVSNAGPNYELSSKRQTVLNSTHPCLGKERGADSPSTPHPSRNAVYSIKDVDLHHSSLLSPTVMKGDRFDQHFAQGGSAIYDVALKGDEKI